MAPQLLDGYGWQSSSKLVVASDHAAVATGLTITGLVVKPIAIRLLRQSPTTAKRVRNFTPRVKERNVG